MFTVKPSVSPKAGLSARVHIGGSKVQVRGAVRVSRVQQQGAVALFDFLKPKNNDDDAPVRVREENARQSKSVQRAPPATPEQWHWTPELWDACCCRTGRLGVSGQCIQNDIPEGGDLPCLERF